MHKYLCHYCNELECETSTCPICGKRTDLVRTEIYYCDKCNAPVFDSVCHICGSECKKVGTDLRPVFAEERLLLEVLLDSPFCFADKSMWCVGSNNFIVNGKKKKIPFSELRKKDPLKVINELLKHNSKNKKYVDTNFDNKFINSFIKCNELRLNLITDEAIEYIKNISSKFDCSNMFVSFSGGKDSTVTSDLVMKALNNESIIHFYGDTTLEYPTTEEYIKSFKCEHKKTPLLVASNKEQDFNNLCEIIGPPSRVMRWCCTVFKTGAITRKIEQTFKNTKRLLSFQGIRRLESLLRSKYERDTDSPKITKQLVSAPIIDWSDFDVWLYILSNKITFNKAYCQGFSRVGCWCCPNNSAWSEYLSAIYMNDKYAAFKNTLYSFAKKVGKQDWKEYIDEGNWRARQGGNGLEHSKNAVVSFKPCALDENSVNFTLSREISEDFYTFLKPFGIVNFDIGNKRLGEVYVLSRITMEPIFKVSGKIGKNELKITINNVVKPYKNAKEIIDLFRNQITKYQTCIGCTYCQSVCKFNALKVNNLNKGNVSTDTISYIIDENKCVGCLECVKHFDGGCYMKKVLRTKKGE